jgi:hypothetical protein
MYPLILFAAFAAYLHAPLIALALRRPAVRHVLGSGAAA